MKKECQVVLLPTKNILDNGRQPHLSPHKMRLVYPVTGAEGRRLRREGTTAANFTPQHLYICSNEEIGVGDWVITQGGHLRQCTDKRPLRDKWVCLGASNLVLTSHCLRVIATTDSSLDNIWGEGKFTEIPQNFIDNYISEYNKRNIITSVMVEYKDLCKYNGEHYPCDCRVLKLNGNEIVIHNSKNSWTREEVEVLIDKAISDHCRLSTSEQPYSDEEEEELIKNWKKKNL